MVHSPIKPISNSTIQLSDAEFDLTAAPQSGRYEVENCVNKFRENRAYLLLGTARRTGATVPQISPQQFVKPFVHRTHAIVTKALPLTSPDAMPISFS